MCIQPAADHVARVVAAARAATPRCAGTTVIAIDGPSGSGKTTLARGVCAALGLAIDEIVHLDELYPGWDGLAAAVGLLTDEVLAPIAAGAHSATYRTWDWEHGRWGGERTARAGRWLLVEGCGSSVMPAGGYAATRVWVDAAPDLRRARGLARDGAEVFGPHWDAWRAQEQALFTADGTAARADVVLDTDGL